MSARVRRLRVSYERGRQLQYVSHLDMMRFWERALRRAHVPVSYSEGFTPHAQIALGAPLSVGMTSRGELMDIFLAEEWTPEQLERAVALQLPPGISVTSVVEVPVGAPSLQSQVRAAEYAFHLRDGADLGDVAARIAALLARESVPWEHRREQETKRYDLRPLVLELRLEQCGGGAVIVAVLRAEEAGTARPDQVVAALELSAAVERIERLALVLAQPVPQT
jgi:radical SAM-linked protein